MKKNFYLWLMLGSLSATAATGKGNTSSEVKASALPVAETIFSEGFETGLGAWETSYSSSSSSFTVREWVTRADAPGGHAGTVAFGVDFTGGDCGSSFQNGTISLMSPAIDIPDGPESNYFLTFDHYFSLENQLDGGVLKYSVDGGAWSFVPSSAFVSNGYNTALTGDNPLAGQAAFSGNGAGWLSTGIRLNGLGVGANKSVRFRWDLATDGCNGLDGWYIDNVKVYLEVVPPPPAQPKVHFVESEGVVSESDAVEVSTSPYDCIRYFDHNVTIKIDATPSAPVTVLISLAEDIEFDPYVRAEEGDGKDYTFAPKKVILQPGELSKDIVVRVFDDAVPEDEEQARLVFSIITDGDAYVEDNTYKLTIKDDDKDKGVSRKDVFSETFETVSMPQGWVYETGGGIGYWGISYFVSESPNPGDYGLHIHSTENRNSSIEVDQQIDSPAFNSLLGFAELKLSFQQVLRLVRDEALPRAIVQIWTGSAWVDVWERNSTSPGFPFTPEDVDINIPIEYANENMKIRFRYYSYLDGAWEIDKIKVTGVRYIIPIAGDVSPAPDRQYLGPNNTVYFYDPQTNAILAKIKNLTAHDYGCTSVEIDRSGDGVTEWLNGYSITNKTLRVIPSNPDPAGKYEITLYYEGSELGPFEGNVASMGKSEGGIGVGDGAGTVAVPIVVSKYNSGYAFTATFETGFSGFGLSNTPPGTSLPVKLLSFEGKSSDEGTVLHWVTTEEVNNDYFTIEKSSDAINYHVVGSVPALKELTNSNNYYFTDRNQAYGIVYYRLKQVDKDGKYMYTKSIAIQLRDEISVVAYPNPTRGLVKFQVAETGRGVATLRVLDSSGKLVSEANEVAFESGLVEYDVSKIHAGIYQVSVFTKEGRYHYKLVKQ